MIYYLHVDTTHPHYPSARDAVETEFRRHWPRNRLSEVVRADGRESIIKADVSQEFIESQYPASVSSGLLLSVGTEPPAFMSDKEWRPDE